MKIFTCLASFFISTSVFAGSYIVVFDKSNDQTTFQPMSKMIETYKAENRRDIARLYEDVQLNSNIRITNDLWAARSIVVNMSESTKSKLENKDYIKSIIENKRRQFLQQPHAPRQVSEVNEQAWGLRYLGIPQIRSMYPDLLGKGVRVAVLDTGIQSRHPEFASVTGPVVFKDFVNRLPYPYDDHGHGTHVAGTVSGVSVGVAPEAHMTVGKILDAGGSAFDSWILEGMQWILDPDGNPDTDDFPHVVNNSWGGGLPNEPVDVSIFEAYHRIIQSWVSTGIIPVFAAGNSGTSPNGFPAAFPEVLAIGAVDQNEGLASFSSRGPNLWATENSIISVAKPDFSAPGVETISAAPNNEYAIMSGTSMATPHAVGMIALLLQANPASNVKSVKSDLFRFSKARQDLGFGLGIIDGISLISSQFPPAP
ncbi:MAG: S8 family serine peptidase [Pseudobacteriovorax sp.]|nr:S8 family serine peptidase [Pseudobacteriovorax sp.]